jgi:hypothetical protein
VVILEDQILQVQQVLRVLQEHLILQDLQFKAQMVLQAQVPQVLQVQVVLPGTAGTSGVSGGGHTFNPAGNAPANFGFQNPEVPDNAGLFAAGWVVVNIGGTDYWMPAWTQ